MLAVSHTAQGRGEGRALTLECMRRAREARKQRLLLHTTALMRAAQHIYTKLGFRRFPEVDFDGPGIVIEGFLLDL
jgi:ribosomal protein S18 acetylase RimI-like enzyme